MHRGQEISGLCSVLEDSSKLEKEQKKKEERRKKGRKEGRKERREGGRKEEIRKRGERRNNFKIESKKLWYILKLQT